MHFSKFSKNNTEKGFREMQIYELVRQAADCWNIPLEQVAKFQEWWDSENKTDSIERISQEYNVSMSSSQIHNIHQQRFSQFYKQHISYSLTGNEKLPTVINLLDIANYYLNSPEITVPNFVINISSQQLYDIAELGESVLVLAGEHIVAVKQEDAEKKKVTGKRFMEYLKKIQLLVEELQLVSPKSLPDLYICNSIIVKFSFGIPVKCRNLILAKKVRIQGIQFIPSQMQVMGGI